jgi:hypothetical protein
MKSEHSVTVPLPLSILISYVKICVVIPLTFDSVAKLLHTNSKPFVVSSKFGKFENFNLVNMVNKMYLNYITLLLVI